MTERELLGDEGQDHESYSDDQDHESYQVEEPFACDICGTYRDHLHEAFMQGEPIVPGVCDECIDYDFGLGHDDVPVTVSTELDNWEDWEARDARAAVKSWEDWFNNRERK